MLEISAEALLAGEDKAEGQVEVQLVDLLRHTQELERQRITLYGIILVIMGMALLVVAMCPAFY